MRTYSVSISLISLPRAACAGHDSLQRFSADLYCRWVMVHSASGLICTVGVPYSPIHLTDPDLPLHDVWYHLWLTLECHWMFCDSDPGMSWVLSVTGCVCVCVCVCVCACVRARSLKIVYRQEFLLYSYIIDVAGCVSRPCG